MDMQLIVISGPDQGRTFALTDAQTLAIGRGQASDAQLRDPRGSRVHCHVEVEGGKVRPTPSNAFGRMPAIDGYEGVSV